MKRIQSIFKVIIIALALRLFLAAILIISFHDSKFDNFADCEGYRLLADNLAGGHGFTGSTHAPFAPDTKRTPGFPLFLSAIQVIFGTLNTPFFIIYSFIGAFSCGIAYLLFRMHFTEKTALIAALILAVDIESILSSNFLLTENLFTFLLLSGVYTLFKYIERGKYGYLLLSILSLTAGIYVRPAGTIIAFVIYAAAGMYYRFQGRMNLKAVIFACLAVVLLMLPWCIRNYSKTGRFEFSSAGESRIFRYWTMTYIVPEARRNGIDIREQYIRMQSQETQEWFENNTDFNMSGDGLPISDMREYEVLKMMKPTIDEMFEGNYIRTVKAHLFGCLGTIFGTTIDNFNFAMLEERLDFRAGLGNTLRQMATGNRAEALRVFFSGRDWYLQIAAFTWSMTMLALGAIGFVYIIRKKLYFPALIFGLIIAYHILNGGIDSPPRFRAPALPFIFIFSASAVELFINRKKSMKQ